MSFVLSFHWESLVSLKARDIGQSSWDKYVQKSTR